MDACRPGAWRRWIVPTGRFSARSARDVGVRQCSSASPVSAGRGVQGRTRASPSHRGTTCTCRWKTSCHPAGRFAWKTVIPSGASCRSSSRATVLAPRITAAAVVGVHVHQVVGMHPRHHEGVPLGGRVDVEEAHRRLVLVHHVGRDRPVDDPAEQARVRLRSRHGPFVRRTRAVAVEARPSSGGRQPTRPTGSRCTQAPGRRLVVHGSARSAGSPGALKCPVGGLEVHSSARSAEGPDEQVGVVGRGDGPTGFVGQPRGVALGQPRGVALGQPRGVALATRPPPSADGPAPGPPSSSRPRPRPRRRAAAARRAGRGTRRGRAGRPAARRPPYGSAGRRPRRPAPGRPRRGRPPARGAPGAPPGESGRTHACTNRVGPDAGSATSACRMPEPALIACTVPGPIGEVWPVESVCSSTPDSTQVTISVSRCGWSG